MSLKSTLELAVVLSVLWAASAVSLAWFNPMNYKQDEVATKALVYVVAPFIFFSAILVVASVLKSMRGRSQTRDEAIKKIEKADVALQSFIGSTGSDWDSKRTYARSLLNDARDALKAGDHKNAERKAQWLITLVKNHSAQMTKITGGTEPVERSGRIDATI